MSPTAQTAARPRWYGCTQKPRAAVALESFPWDQKVIAFDTPANLQTDGANTAWYTTNQKLTS
jgi:hypothetical protein